MCTFLDVSVRTQRPHLDAELDSPHCEHDGSGVVLDELLWLWHFEAALLPRIAQQRRWLQGALHVLVVRHLQAYSIATPKAMSQPSDTIAKRRIKTQAVCQQHRLVQPVLRAKLAEGLAHEALRRWLRHKHEEAKHLSTTGTKAQPCGVRGVCKILKAL